jgi:carboxypeptidase Taq
MGNLIGGQIWARLQADLGDTESLMARGEFGPILEWLTAKVYSKASLMPPRDLLVSVTDEGMNPAHWLKYAEDKYRGLYGL